MALEDRCAHRSMPLSLGAVLFCISVAGIGGHAALGASFVVDDFDLALREDEHAENLAKLEQKYPEKFKELRVIWTSPLIPSDPLVMRKDLPDATKAKIKAFFAAYGKASPAEKEVMARMNWSQFRESSNAQLTPIRQLDLFGKRNKIVADSTLSEADKKQQLAEIDKKLAALN